MSDIDQPARTAADPESARREAVDHARELERALAEKTALLHEVDHRVKNNLQLIASLLQLQSRRTPDETTRQAVRGILERVNAIGAVHRKLFQGGDVQRFDLADFVRDLAGDLAASARRDDIQLKLDLEAVAVPASQAAPLALIVNELISNALKHAFPGRPGIISVSIRRTPEGFVLTVADDGQGRAEGSATGFGMTIIQLLCQQVKARLSYEDAAPGLRAVVAMPLEAAP
jgi:two-component sensor histidine kinase